MFTLLILLDLAAFVGLSWAVDSDFDLLAILLVILGVAGTLFFTGTNPIPFVQENFVAIAAGFAGWFVVGAAWSYFKWWRLLKSDAVQADIVENYSYWRKKFPTLDKNAFLDSYDAIKVSHNKSTIMRWITFWPASMFWFLTYKLIINVAETIYNAVRSTYQALADSITKKIISVIPDPVPPATSNTAPTTGKVQLNG